MYDNLDFLIYNFRDFLNNSYNNVEKIYNILDWDNLTDWFTEWSEKNFFYFVSIHIENEINGVLYPYNYTSYKKSEVIKKYKNKKIYRIVCKINNELYCFVGLVGKKDNNEYSDCAPFDFVVVEKNRKILYFKYTEIEKFHLQEINNEIGKCDC